MQNSNTEIKVLVLRSANARNEAYGNFKWPKSGPVECPDWDPAPHCGNGLHGLLWGEGDASLTAGDAPHALWSVVEVDANDVVELQGKVKFPRGEVIYCGTRDGAVALIQERRPGAAVIYGKSTSGHGGTSTSGHGGTSTSGYGGTSTSGDRGTSTSGDGGTSTSGDRGMSTSGYGGTSTSGYGGTLIIRYYDGARYRIAVGYIGENGLRAGVAYKVDNKGNFAEAK